MRWSKPSIGDIRLKKGFALLPREMPDGDTVWLERYKVMQEYRYCFNGGSRWRDIMWRDYEQDQ